MQQEAEGEVVEENRSETYASAVETIWESLGVITEGKGKLVRGSPSQALPNFFLRDCHSLVQ